MEPRKRISRKAVSIQQKHKSNKARVSYLAVEERIERAKKKVSKLVDHTIHLLNIHEANRIIVYSHALAGQIPRSRAAHAFNYFQHGSFEYEIIRLCAIWDPCAANDLAKESIPAVLQLINGPQILDALHHRWLLEPTIRAAERIARSSQLVKLRNYRDKQIAHALESTRLEATAVVAPPQYGDERLPFWKTIAVLKGLYIGVNDTDFAWKDSMRIARRNAEALWHGCTFQVKA